MVFRSFDFWEAIGYTTPWWNLWTRNKVISKEYTSRKQHFWRCWWCTGNGKNCIKKVGMKKFLGSFGKNNIRFVNNMESVLTLMNWKVCGYDYRSSDSGSLRGFLFGKKNLSNLGNDMLVLKFMCSLYLTLKSNMLNRHTIFCVWGPSSGGFNVHTCADSYNS